MEPVDHVEDDERARGGERSLPRRVREQEAADFCLLPEDAPAPLEVRADTFEDAPVAAVLADEHDRCAARCRRHERREHERPRVPNLQQPAADDQRSAQRDPAQHVLHALRAPVRRLRQEIRVQPAVRRLVHVVREEEREDDQRSRP